MSIDEPLPVPPKAPPEPVKAEIVPVPVAPVVEEDENVKMPVGVLAPVAAVALATGSGCISNPLASNKPVTAEQSSTLEKALSPTEIHNMTPKQREGAVVLLKRAEKEIENENIADTQRTLRWWALATGIIGAFLLVGGFAGALGIVNPMVTAIATPLKWAGGIVMCGTFALLAVAYILPAVGWIVMCVMGLAVVALIVKIFETHGIDALHLGAWVHAATGTEIVAANQTVAPKP